MNDRPASWHADPKQMEKLAAEAARKWALPAAAPDKPLPPEYRQSVLKDPRAVSRDSQTRQRRLSFVGLDLNASSKMFSVSRLARSPIACTHSW